MLLTTFRQPVGVEHEPERTEQVGGWRDPLVRGEEDAAEAALDALGPGGVVAGRHELTPAPPGAPCSAVQCSAVRCKAVHPLVQDVECEGVWEPGGEEYLAVSTWAGNFPPGSSISIASIGVVV
jgi:hypothetical protein